MLRKFRSNETKKILKIDDLTVELAYKAVKRVNLRLSENRSSDTSSNKDSKSQVRISISVPLGTSEHDVINFVREHRDWIDRNLPKIEDRVARRDSEEPRSGAELRRAREELRARIARRLPDIEQETGLRANGWNIRDMHTRWGSCNIATHHLNFSLMLATRTDEELDYVIVHELVHTIVAGHGKDFYAKMDELMPDWRRIRKQLRG